MKIPKTMIGVSWDEVRTAYQVAAIGTVSGAADVLGVHHATVIRHIDSLEAHFGAKLFQRHTRGYTTTDAGRELFRSAQIADEQFAQMTARIEGQRDAISGTLVVTSVINTSKFLMPILTSFQRKYPAIQVKYIADGRMLRLEHGEAHVALRVGAKPKALDYVVRSVHVQRFGLYVHQSYIDTYGLPDPDKWMQELRFIGGLDETSRPPAFQWVHKMISEAQICFRVGNFQVMKDAVLSGAGAGFLDIREAERQSGLTEICPAQPEWDVESWLVTHVDLHRAPKVQAFLQHLKEHAKADGVDEG